MKISKKIIAAALATSMMASMSAATSAATEDIEIEEIEVEEEIIIETPVYGYIGQYVSVSSSTEITDEAALNEKLAEVTLIVRNTLGIGDEYTSFNGDFADNITNRQWYLNWSNDDERINVTAAEDGTVMRYRKNFTSDYNDKYQSYNNFFDPKFQKNTREDAREVVKAFMRRVLNEDEGYVLSETGAETLSPVGVSDYYFMLILTVNGLETPISMNVTVSADKLEVINFWRNDSSDSYFGEYPSASPNFTEDKAFDSLSTKFNHTLKYYIVYDEDDTEHKNPKAELQYKFNSTGDWFFDAKTGETVNRNDLFDDVYESGSKDMEFEVTEDAVVEEAAPEFSANGGFQLTEVELESIEKMKDIIKGEDIAKMIDEKYPEFGLDKFDLVSTSYTRNTETDEVTASLQFSKRVTRGAQIGMNEEIFKQRTEEEHNVYYIRKYISANGKTGELFTYNTSYPYVSEKYSDKKTHSTDTQKAAEAFLKKNFSEEFASSALTNTYTNNINTYSNYTYTHTVNGYTLDQNWLSVRINAIDGTVDTFNKSWVYGVEFESPEGIISAEEALDIYTTRFTAKLQYITVPVAIDDQAPEFMPYINAGWSSNSYVFSFKTAYKLNEEFYASGVRAKDGKLLKNEGIAFEGWGFTDLDNCESKDKIETLALYGITFGEKEFKPANLLSQKDMLVYLLNAMGHRYSVISFENDDDGFSLNNIYDRAIYYGFITEDERDPDKLMRVEDVAKALIMPSEYNAATKLDSLFKANFKDKDDATDGYLPYLAIAEALGLIEKDSDNNINPDGLMTREDLAKAIYAFMDR